MRHSLKLAFFTNYPSHHQIPLGKAFASRLGADQYSLVCWDRPEEERINLGWPTEFEEDWITVVGNSDARRAYALELLHSVDILIWGYAPYDSIAKRLAQGKLTFRYTERLFKKGKIQLLNPRMLNAIRRIKALDSPTHHLLAVGPHCAHDYRNIGMFPRRRWLWGYFTEVPSRAGDERTENPIPRLLWAGRMLDWKQVDLVVRAAKWVRNHSTLAFRLDLIGQGPEEANLRALVHVLGLDDVCFFLGPRKSKEVLKAMQQADIFVLPSNKTEGWGAVVNEAMSCACCVVASRHAGSAVSLINDGNNGHLFDGKSAQQLGEKLLVCLTHPEQRRAMGRQARETITDLWSPDVAAERFLALCTRLAEGGDATSLFTDNGPCVSM